MMEFVTNLDDFVELARVLNFSKAAASLNITQSTLSKRIDTFERDLGFKLFERTTREVRLTPAGRAFYKDVLGMTREYREAAQRAKALSRQQRQVLTIGGNLANRGILALVEKLQAYLDVNGSDFDVTPNQGQMGSNMEEYGAMEAFETALAGVNDLDIMFLSKEVSTSPLHVEVLYRDPLVAFVPRGSKLANLQEVATADLASYHIIRSVGYTAFYQRIAEVFVESGLEIRTVTRLIEAPRDIVARADDEVYITCASMAEVVSPPAISGYILLPWSDENAYVEVCAAYLPERHRPCIDACIEALKTIVAL